MANEIPTGATIDVEGKVHNVNGELIEFVEGKWTKVLNGDRVGWWRYHDHYNRNGYCDDPARGY